MGTINYRADCKSLTGERYVVEIRTPSGKDKPFTDITLAADGIQMQRKGAGDEVFSVVETQVTIKAVSATDRQYASLYYQKEDDPITVDIFKDGRLYWCGRLLPEQFYEPFSFSGGYMTELVFSDFGCLAQTPYTGGTNLGGLVRSAVSHAFEHNKHRPPLTGLSDDFGKRYPTFTPTLDAFIIKRTLYGARENVHMYDVLKDILKSFSLRLEQRDGRVYLYDLYSIQDIQTRILEPVGADAQLETLQVSDIVELKLAGSTALPFSEEPKDLVDDATAKWASVYRTDTEGSEVSHVLRTSGYGKMLHYRVEPKSAGKYDYGVMVVSDPKRGIEPALLNKIPDYEVNKIATAHFSSAPDADPYTDLRVLDSCHRFFSTAKWCYEHGRTRAWLHPPAYDIVSDLYELSEGSQLHCKLDLEVLLSRSYNFVEPRINLKRFKTTEGGFPLAYMSRAEAFAKSCYKELYVAADITAEDASGKTIARLWNLFADPATGALIDGLPMKNNIRATQAEFYMSENAGYATKVHTGDWFSNYTVSNGTGGLLHSNPSWSSEHEDCRLCTFIRVGGHGDGELRDDEWHNARSWGLWDKDGFVFPLYQNFSVGLTRIRVKVYPYIIVSFKKRNDKDKKGGDKSYVYDGPSSHSEQKGSYNKRYILYRGAKLSLFSNVDNKRSATDGGVVVRGWLGAEKGKATEVELPIATKPPISTPLFNGLAICKDSGLLSENGGLAYAGRDGASVERYLDFYFGLNGVRRNLVRGSYGVVHGLMPVCPPGMDSPDEAITRHGARSYYIDNESVSLLQGRSSMEVRELPGKKIKGERVL